MPIGNIMREVNILHLRTSQRNPHCFRKELSGIHFASEAIHEKHRFSLTASHPRRVERMQRVDEAMQRCQGQGSNRGKEDGQDRQRAKIKQCIGLNLGYFFTLWHMMSQTSPSLYT